MRQTGGRWVEDGRMKEEEEEGRTKGTEAGREDRTKPEVRRDTSSVLFHEKKMKNV